MNFSKIFIKRNDEDFKRILQQLIKVGAPKIYRTIASTFILETEQPILNEKGELFEIVIESNLKKILKGDFDQFNSPMNSYRFKDNCEEWHGKYWPIGFRSDGNSILLGVNENNLDRIFRLDELTGEEILLSNNIKEFCDHLSLSKFT